MTAGILSTLSIAVLLLIAYSALRAARRARSPVPRSGRGAHASTESPDPRAERVAWQQFRSSLASAGAFVVFLLAQARQWPASWVVALVVVALASWEVRAFIVLSEPGQRAQGWQRSAVTVVAGVSSVLVTWRHVHQDLDRLLYGVGLLIAIAPAADSVFRAWVRRHQSGDSVA